MQSLWERICTRPLLAAMAANIPWLVVLSLHSLSGDLQISLCSIFSYPSVCVYLLPLPPFNKIHVIAFRAHLSLGILACAQATVTKYYTLGGLNNGNLLPTPGGWKSQIRVHQGSVSGELSSSLADVYLLTMSSLAFSPCVYMELGYGRESSLVSHEDTDPHL